MKIKNAVGEVELSVVVPIYNEEPNIDELCTRLWNVLQKQKRSFEIVLVNDGSKDQSLDLLLKWYHSHKGFFRIIDFNGNFGHHNALIAAFEHVRGEVIVTLDADLQNPPEEIPNLLAKIDEGFDYVGSYRRARKDSKFRCWASWLNNRLRSLITKIHMKDQGCMLRAFKRPIIDAILRCVDYSTFIPALAYQFASNYTEVEVEHAPRFQGESKYGLYYLLRVHFDLMTGFSLVPLQLFTFLGFGVSGLSFLLVVYMLFRRLIIGPEVEGVFTLFAILFFLVSVAITGIGLIGEYVGRMYQIIQQRPRYVLKNIWSAEKE